MSVAPPGKQDLSAAEAWRLMGELFFTHARPRMLALGQEFELSPPQTIVLRLLDEPKPMGALAQLMHCDNSNMTGLVDRLEERGLVERTQADGDRRVRLIALTDRGSEMRDELVRRMAEPPAPLTELSAADQRALTAILGRALAGR
jgi:MarR family transcriptional regulator, organic hydroperoxide resistance regulator